MSGFTIPQWVQAAIIHAGGMPQAELARRLEQKMHRAYDRSMVYKIVKGTRRVTADELLAIQEITGYAAPINASARITYVPLCSWADVADLVDPTVQIKLDGTSLLAFADLGDGEFFALTVGDDSMDRVSPDQSVIVINRSDRTLIDSALYVAVARGLPLFRRWHASPPYLAPLSTNIEHEPIMLNRRSDVDVIGRVRRTTKDL